MTGPTAPWSAPVAPKRITVTRPSLPNHRAWRSGDDAGIGVTARIYPRATKGKDGHVTVIPARIVGMITSRQSELVQSPMRRATEDDR